MEIIKTVKGSEYVDQQLFDYINQIWLTFHNNIPDNSNLFFLKNVTVPRLVTDYTNKNIHRVIKKEKATHCIIDKFTIDNYFTFYDRSTNTRTDDDSKEVIYPLSGHKPETIETIKQILWFINSGQIVTYASQDVLNSAINNGFIIDNDNYTVLKELIDSEFNDNHKLACNMLINSDLDKNFQWILYLYHNNSAKLIDHDNKNRIVSFYKTKNNLNLSSILNSFDSSIRKITDEDVKDKMIQMKKHEFYTKAKDYLKGELRTQMFDLLDFEIKLKDYVPE